MSINVMLNGESIQIDQAVFRTLLDNSVAGLYAGYQSALESGSIKFADLVKLAKHGDIPYPLFFSPLELVEAQVEAKTPEAPQRNQQRHIPNRNQGNGRTPGS